VGEPTKTTPPPPDTGSESERRRVGKVVHDDRGNALVEWEDAPADYQRVVLEVVNDGRSAPGAENDFNPYAQRTPRARSDSGATTRTDLRKLSEWIKKMRELEERKRNGDDQDQDQDPD
jgi:hypothetical protein